MIKMVLVIVALLFVSFLAWSRLWVEKGTISIKNNQTVKEEVIVENSEFELFSTKENLLVLVTTRSYMKGSGRGIIALSVNDEIRNSSDTLVVNDEDISTYTLSTVRELKFGTNQVELVSWVDGKGELVITSVDVSWIK